MKYIFTYLSFCYSIANDILSCSPDPTTNFEFSWISRIRGWVPKFATMLYKRLFVDLPVQYMKTTSSEQGEKMLCTNIVFVFVSTFRTIYAHNMFSSCSELVVFMYWTGKSMNNLLPYCGLVVPRTSASDKDLLVNLKVVVGSAVNSLRFFS